MSANSKRRGVLFAALLILAASVAWHRASADDMFHDVTGVVKSVDKATKTVVIKTADGTEHTIKYTSKTTVEGTKDAGKGVGKAATESYLGAKKGAKVTIHYTEKGGEKTAVGVKDAVD